MAPAPSLPRQVPIDEVPSDAPAIEATNAPDGVRWRIVLGRDEMWLFPDGATKAFALTHNEYLDHTSLARGLRRSPKLAVRELPTKLTLAIPNAALEPLRRWMGTHYRAHLARALKKRVLYSVPLGLLVIVGALPILDSKWDYPSLTYGTWLLLLTSIGPRRPHAAFFLVEAGLWIASALDDSRDLVRTGMPWLIPFAALQLTVAAAAVRAYVFYRPRASDVS